jgi:predicted O-linked N-acetylglucosamine transferase (SPINDLY family)
MGFTDLIVSTPQQYIETAVRLGTDRSERDRVSASILELCPILFDDPQEVRCLETWLWSLT